MIQHRGVTAHLFPPSRLGVYAVVEGSNLRRLHGTKALSDTGAAVALDGSMYSDIGSGLARPRFLMMDQARGVLIETRSPSDGMTISVKNGVASANTDAVVTPGATVAVQLYPELVRSGRNMANPLRDTSVVWRAALGIFRDGNLGFAVGVSSMYTFAQHLSEMGFVHAGYTDGGDSTLMAFRDGSWVGDREHRAVSSWILDNGSTSSETNSGDMGAVLAAIGLGWLIYEMSR